MPIGSSASYTPRGASNGRSESHRPSAPAGKKEAPPSPAPEAQPISLLTVASSSIATSGDKSTVALVLKTEEAGPVAFQLTVEACADSSLSAGDRGGSSQSRKRRDPTTKERL